ncbi:hypothetical protein L3X38_011184 [Prunus dulcis]|uniref:Disease resistance N-terminal domain-containing protein n=1 Tax=Prunus dulcis TaxID=3755 RepID=A0AAD4WGX8_PRUDU|nr:hypothetical protein L3X38_011184 [Prunus dulcis]
MEERQLITESKPLKLWLDDLRDLAYNLEDVLDKYATKVLKWEIELGHYAGTARRLWNSVPNGVFVGANFPTRIFGCKDSPFYFAASFSL